MTRVNERKHPDQNQERVGPSEIILGVTGHQVLAQTEEIRAGISTALKQIQRCFPGRTITVMSSLAEGADRLAAKQALAQHGAKLVVPLPMPKANYIEDFASSESKLEFSKLLSRAIEVIELPHRAQRQESYQAAGEYVLDHCEVLLAVWDGNTEQGEGGTGSIAVEARKRKLPFVWVHAGNRRPGTQEPTSLGAEQGEVTYENFAPLIYILEALERHDPEAMRLQRKRWNFARVAASIGPLAVALLVVQVLVLGDIHYGLAVSLIVMELLLLAIALCISFLGIGRSHKGWMRERLCTEILRREESLLLARVGPYLAIAPALLANRVQQRLLLIENEVRNPLELLSTTEEEICWRDELEDAHKAGTLPEFSDFAYGIGHYIENRVSHQKKWFSERSHAHERSSRWFENGAKVILIGALILAATHLGHLLAQHGGAAQKAGQELKTSSGAAAGPKTVEDSHSSSGTLPAQKSGQELKTESERWTILGIIIAAILLPPLGAMLVGLQSILGSERLAGSYRYHASELLTMEQSLRELQDRLQARDAPPTIESQFRFMRAVLVTEALLSDELRQWWLVMYPTSPRAGP